MSILNDIFEERNKEIKDYIIFLGKVESREKGYKSIKTQQYHVLLANLFILMYNMVEAVMAQATCFVEDEIYHSSQEMKLQNKKFHECLSDNIRNQWILSYFDDNQLTKEHSKIERYKKFYYAVSNQEFPSFKMKIAHQGNWDDLSIENFLGKIGIKLSISKALKTKVKALHYTKSRSGKLIGPIQYITDQRNRLAHGVTSFSDCGKERNIADLNQIYLILEEYLQNIVTAFEGFIEQRSFLQQEKTL